MDFVACKLYLNKNIFLNESRNFEILRHLLVSIESKNLEVAWGPEKSG